MFIDNISSVVPASSEAAAVNVERDPETSESTDAHQAVRRASHSLLSELLRLAQDAPFIGRNSQKTENSMLSPGEARTLSFLNKNSVTTANSVNSVPPGPALVSSDVACVSPLTSPSQQRRVQPRPFVCKPSPCAIETYRLIEESVRLRDNEKTELVPTLLQPTRHAEAFSTLTVMDKIPIAPSRLLVNASCEENRIVDCIETPSGKTNESVVTLRNRLQTFLGNLFSGKNSPPLQNASSAVPFEADPSGKASASSAQVLSSAVTPLLEFQNGATVSSRSEQTLQSGVMPGAVSMLIVIV